MFKKIIASLLVLIFTNTFAMDNQQKTEPNKLVAYFYKRFTEGIFDVTIFYDKNQKQITATSFAGDDYKPLSLEEIAKDCGVYLAAPMLEDPTLASEYIIVKRP